MSTQILKAMQATEMNLRRNAASKPTTPSGGLLSRTGNKDTTNITTTDNIASYVKQIRAARTTHA